MLSASGRSDILDDIVDTERHGGLWSFPTEVDWNGSTGGQTVLEVGVTLKEGFGEE